MSKALTEPWLLTLSGDAAQAREIVLQRLQHASSRREVEGLVLTWQQLNIASAALSSAHASFQYSEG